MPPESACDSQQAWDCVLAEVLWKTRETVAASRDTWALASPPRNRKSKGPNSLATAPSLALTFSTRPQPSGRHGPWRGV